MSQILAESIQRWVDDLSAALQLYMESHELKSVAQLARQLDLDERAMQMIVKGDRVFTKNIEIYAEIYDQLGIVEADPRQIPVYESTDPERQNLRTVVPLAWTQDRYDLWYATKHPPVHDDQEEQSDSHPILSDPSYIQHRALEREFTDRFLDALSAWMRDNWTGSVASFCKSLGIESGWISSMKSESNRYVSDRTARYAAVYRRTGIPEAYPGRIPDKIRVLPNGIKREGRAWTDDQYAKWAKAQEEREAKTNLAKQSRQSVDDQANPQVQQSEIEPVETAPPKVTPQHAEDPILPPPLEQPQAESTVGLSESGLAVGLAFDLIVKAIRSIAQPPVQPQSNLDSQIDRLESVLTRLENLATPTPPAPARPISGQDPVKSLVLQLTSQLQTLRRGTEADRTKFVSSAGQQMADLMMLTRGFTILDPEKREHFFNTLQEI